MGIKKFFTKLVGIESPETMEDPFAPGEELKPEEIKEGLKELPSETLEKPLTKTLEESLTKEEIGEALEAEPTIPEEMTKAPSGEIEEPTQKEVSKEEIREVLKPLEKASERAKTEVPGEEDFPTT